MAGAHPWHIAGDIGAVTAAMALNSCIAIYPLCTCQSRTKSPHRPHCGGCSPKIADVVRWQMYPAALSVEILRQQ
jgi:hypothetical protein